MNQTLKRYLISTGITFLSAFLTVFLAALSVIQDDEFTLSFLIALVISSFYAGIRAVAKLGLEILNDRI